MKIITGASRGIGLYLLKRYAKYENVRGTYLTTEPGDDLHEYYTKVDVTCYSDVLDWISSIQNLESQKITLINCAGIKYDTFCHKSEPYDWAHVIDVNLIGTFNTIRAILPWMRKNGWGRIINLSSIASTLGVEGTSAYAASKAGLLGLMKVVAEENGLMGITCNNLNLGYFDIGMGETVPFSLVDRIKERIPTHRFGDPATIYSAINFLTANSYVNGAGLDLNGGLM